ncbi:MAG TPA: hypothetical protein VI792_11095 [Candidatus Eisenbacteria bacterium]
MDDTRQPSLRRSAPRAGPPFLTAALTLGVFAALCVWPRTIPGLPPAPRLALLALLLAGTLRWLMRPRRGTPRPRSARRRSPVSAPGPAAAAVADAGGAWLHVVSASEPASLARGTLELAAALSEAGARLLVVDGARRLGLHQRLGLASDPGLLECLAGEVPVLEAIQHDADGNLSLLARGNPMRPEVWPQLGRLLGRARTRFDRVLLALDFAAPREAGVALEGLDPQGWWVFDGVRTGLASAVEERIGIPLRNIGLESEPDAVDEVVAKPRELPRPALTPPPAPAPVAGGPVRVEARRRRIERAVVDCDLQVRERLRFLIWMKQLQAEGQRELGAPRRAAPAVVGAGAARGPRQKQIASPSRPAADAMPPVAHGREPRGHDGRPDAAAPSDVASRA